MVDIHYKCTLDARIIDTHTRMKQTIVLHVFLWCLWLHVHACTCSYIIALCSKVGVIASDRVNLCRILYIFLYENSHYTYMYMYVCIQYMLVRRKSLNSNSLYLLFPVCFVHHSYVKHWVLLVLAVVVAVFLVSLIVPLLSLLTDRGLLIGGLCVHLLNRCCISSSRPVFTFQ